MFSFMARKVITTVTDDLDGSPDAEEVSFSFEGHDYTIDLSNENFKKLSDLLQPYIEAGTRKSGLPRKQKRATGPQRDLNDVRAFARAKGHKIAERGRIPQHILEEYDRENGGKS